MDSLGVLVVGCGSMGTSHARAYHAIDGFHVTGVVSRGAASRTVLAAELGVPAYDSFEQGIAAGGVQVVSVNTHPDSHYRYALAALQADCHLPAAARWWWATSCATTRRGGASSTTRAAWARRW